MYSIPRSFINPMCYFIGIWETKTGALHKVLEHASGENMTNIFHIVSNCIPAIAISFEKLPAMECRPDNVSGLCFSSREKTPQWRNLCLGCGVWKNALKLRKLNLHFFVYVKDSSFDFEKGSLEIP